MKKIAGFLGLGFQEPQDRQDRQDRQDPKDPKDPKVLAVPKVQLG
jgi:hypothetical protein